MTIIITTKVKRKVFSPVKNGTPQWICSRHFGKHATKVLVKRLFGDNISKIQVGTNVKTMRNDDLFVIL